MDPEGEVVSLWAGAVARSYLTILYSDIELDEHAILGRGGGRGEGALVMLESGLVKVWWIGE